MFCNTSAFCLVLLMVGTLDGAEQCTSLRDCQRQLKQLKALVVDLLPLSQHDTHQYPNDDKQLFSFLEENDFDVPLTATAIRKWFQFRAENFADDETQTPSDDLLELMKFETVGRDFNDNLSFYAALSFDELKTLAKKDRKEVIRTYVYRTEQTRKEIQEAKASGTNIIIDMRNMDGIFAADSLSAANLAQDLFKNACGQYRPANRLVVVTPDGWTDWSPYFLPLMPKGTRETLQVVDESNAEDELRKVMPFDSIPRKLLRAQSSLLDADYNSSSRGLKKSSQKNSLRQFLPVLVGGCMVVSVVVGIVFTLRRAQSESGASSHHQLPADNSQQGQELGVSP
eukprot:TRINITY_DN106531_c0_g1_i1.p1 TRINITY_DN106531_c0_g1~~TRINITY_DN106531_c0_g1_i1.p1  ORF type:complete len:341 (-),score=40.10 TRINITY_DN106531_c0_g1_i1:119-1141(-)